MDMFIVLVTALIISFVAIFGSVIVFSVRDKVGWIEHFLLVLTTIAIILMSVVGANSLWWLWIGL